MADWTEQVAEMQRSWVAQQQQVMKEWLGSVKSPGDDSLRASWRNAADMMEEQLKSALDTQTRSLLSCVENIEKVDGMPEEAVKALAKTKETVNGWAQVQGDIWKVWFDTVRQTAPPPQTPAEALMESWEELAKKTMSIQNQWLAK